MKLWILGIKPHLAKNDDPWYHPWDTNMGFVIRARSEDEARLLASQQSGDEQNWNGGSPWLSVRYTTCDELQVDGEIGVVLTDFNAG